MRILVADTFPDAPLTELREGAHECTYRPELTAEDLPGELTGCEVLIVRSTRVSAAALEGADALRLVIRAGSGTNTIDCEAATARGIHVCNVPGRNAAAVAELAMGLLLALDRNIADCVTDARAGRWDKKRYSRAHGIRGRRIGVVGLGQIGSAFAERAAAFGAHVHAVANPRRDRHTLEQAHEIGIEFVDSLHTLARTCDVLSLHLPANEATHHLLDRTLLEQVPPETIILNTARGELVDEDALIEAMDSKGVRAGVDVFADEPGTSSGEVDSRLVRHPNVYATHHIGASTEQAQQAVAAEVVRMIDAFAEGTVLHCVNFDSAPPQRSGEMATSLRSGSSMS